MKVLVKLLSLTCLAWFALCIYANVSLTSEKGSVAEMTYLVVGFDESPANTDVLCVVTYDSDANTVRALQIPRDTAVKYGNDTMKINGYYSRKVAEGATHQSALKALSNKIRTLFGIDVDGYVAVTTNGLRELVDFLGGVYISEGDVPNELKGAFASNNGKIFLSGEDSLRFIRYRSDYVRGDLDRLDAQKTFIKALAHRIGAEKDVLRLIRFSSDLDSITLDINRGSAFSFFISNVFQIGNADFQIATLPGKAVKHNDIWYYLVNKERSIALIQGYFPGSYISFDEEDSLVYSF